MITRTIHTLPFKALSPADFERLCLWLIENEGYENVRHFGSSGADRGRDILAEKDQRLIAFQCKRVNHFTARDVEEELEKLAFLPEAEVPDDVFFLISASVSAQTRTYASNYWGARGSCTIWADTEMDEKVNRHEGIVSHFFGPKSRSGFYLGQANCPYPGLEPFEEKMASFFYGRSPEIEELLLYYQRIAVKKSTNWLQVEGPSGYGKSSLIKAGLVPEFRKGTVGHFFKRWAVLMFRPGSDPIENLYQSILRLSGDGLSCNEEGVKDRLIKDSTTLTEIAQDARDSGTGLLVVLDQLEELFTVNPSVAPKVAMLDSLLAHLLNSSATATCLVTIVRSDFLGHYYCLPRLESMLNSHAYRYHLRPMNEKAIVEAIERPVTQQGLQWETDDLPMKIASEAIEQSHGMQVIAHALRELWIKDHQKGVLTHATLNRLGGVSGAVSSSAERLLKDIGPDPKSLTRAIFLSLVRVGRGTADVRRIVSRQEVLAATGYQAEAEAILTYLSGGRSAYGQGEAATTRLIVVGAGEQVELVHESLIKTWPTLTWWVKEYREQLEVRDDLEDAARAWQAAGNPVEWIPTGQQLNYFRKARGHGLLAKRFMDEAEKAASREKRQRSFSRRSLLTGVSLLVILSVSMSLLALVYVYANRSYLASRILSLAAEDLQSEMESDPARLLVGIRQVEVISLLLLGEEPQNIDHRRLLAQIKLTQGEASLDLRDIDQARENFLQAILLSEAIDGRKGAEIETLAILGRARTELADPIRPLEKKAQHLKATLEAVQSGELKDGGGILSLHEVIAEVTLLGQEACSSGFFEKCSAFLGIALSGIREAGIEKVGYRILDQRLVSLQARTLYLVGNHEDARFVLEEALEIHQFGEWLKINHDKRLSDDALWFSKINYLLAEIAYQQEDFRSSAEYGRAALEILDGGIGVDMDSLVKERVEVLRLISLAEHETSNYPEALSFSMEAADFSAPFAESYPDSPTLVGIYLAAVEHVLAFCPSTGCSEPYLDKRLDYHLERASHLVGRHYKRDRVFGYERLSLLEQRLGLVGK